MARHGMARILSPPKDCLPYHMKFRLPDWDILKIFHTSMKYESWSFFHCEIIFIAFYHHDLIKTILFNMSGCTKSCAGSRDKVEASMILA